MVKVTIEDVDEIRTLHRMLYQRKFFDGPQDEFYGSPFIASVQRRLLTALRELEGPPRYDSWDEWTDARTHDREIEQVRSYLSELGEPWTSMALEQRASLVRDMLSPLDVPDDILDDLTRA